MIAEYPWRWRFDAVDRFCWCSFLIYVYRGFCRSRSNTVDRFGDAPSRIRKQSCRFWSPALPISRALCLRSDIVDRFGNPVLRIRSNTNQSKVLSLIFCAIWFRSNIIIIVDGFWIGQTLLPSAALGWKFARIHQHRRASRWLLSP